MQLFGHHINPAEIIGIGPLLKRQTTDPVQNESYNPWKLYFTLCLRNYSMVIESEFFELGDVMIPEYAEQWKAWGAWAKQYDALQEYIIQRIHLEKNIHQNKNNMEFFQNLAGISDKLELTLRIQSINGKLTVAVIPDTLKDIQSLDITGTPEEMDEGFFDLIRQPLEIATGLRSNVDEATKSFEAAAGTAQPAATTAAATDGKLKDEKKTRTRKAKDETPAQEQPTAAVEQNATEQTGQIKELLTDAAESATQQLPGNEPAEGAAPKISNDEIKAMMEGAVDTAQLRNIHEAHEEAISASELLTRVFHTRHDELAIPDPTIHPATAEELPQAQPAKPAPPKPAPPKPAPPKPGIPTPAATATPPQEAADAGLFNQETTGTI